MPKCCKHCMSIKAEISLHSRYPCLHLEVEQRERELLIPGHSAGRAEVEFQTLSPQGFFSHLPSTLPDDPGHQNNAEPGIRFFAGLFLGARYIAYSPKKVL